MANTKLSRTAHAEHTSEVTIISSSKIALETTQVPASKSPENGFSLTAPPLPFKNDNISPSAERKQIVFIDQGVEDYPSLIAGTKAGIEVHVIDSRQDGVLQITDILKQRSAISAVHIVSHGNVGYLALGNSVLSTETLNHYQDALFSWRRALNDDADILVYGCEVAKGLSGEQFIQQLAFHTGANIAASSHLIGNSRLGGNWILDISTNDIVSELVFCEENLKYFSSTLTTNTLDFSSDIVSNYVTATHPTANFGTINLKIINDADSTGTANASLTLATAGEVNDSFNDFYYTGADGEYLVIYTDGREVSFQSVKFGSIGPTIYTSLTGYAYRDGILLGSQTITPSGTNFPNDLISITPEAVTFTSNIFKNADEIRLIGTNIYGDDVGQSLIDDLVIADAIVLPLITSATYNASTGVLVVTGTDIQANSSGADIDVSKLIFTGEGGTPYTLTDSADVERDSSTQFTVTLSATDKAAINQIINKSGTLSTSGTTYNLAAVDDWNTNVTDGDTADTTGNGITVSNVAAPTITSATYDANTGALVVTGTNFLKASGAANDIDVSKFTFTGEGGATYTLTDTADVEIASGTAFTITLSATDKAAINLILNKNGNLSTDISTYILSAAEDWAAGADAAVDVEDTFNNITVSNVAIPTINSATYDAGTGALAVTGTNFLKASGAANDIDVSKFTFTGEGGATYTLTDTADVEIASGTAFTITLSATDKAAINLILNKNGNLSTDISTYILSAAEDWAAGADAAVDVEDTFNNITVSNVAIPTINSATYDAGTGALAVTGTNFLKASGAANDIDVSKFTFTGEGGATYTLTTANVEITSGTSFAVTLNATDQAAINQIINKNGTSSTGGTPYNLAAAEDWAAGADAAVTVADLTGNGITVSNVAAPTINSATYDASTGTLVVTGSGFLSRSGTTNDIVASKFTLRGEGGATYTLTDTANAEITSGTAFTLTLSATDKAAVNQIINKNGTLSTDISTYNLAAAEDWAAGADAAVVVADTTGNGITVSNVAVPTINSTTYDASTGTLVVTGSDFLSRSGATNDIDASKFTFTGEGGATHTLTDTANVEITSGTAFTIALGATDKAAVDALLNRNGTSSYDATTYNLAAAEDWAAGADATVTVADMTGNSITVSNVATPTITSTTYDASTGVLVVTGANIQAKGSGADIDASKLTFTGEGGATYTLTDSADVERQSATQFTITLSATDKAAINQTINKNGTSSTSGTSYNLAAADDWNTNVTDGDIADATGNGITVSNVAIPTINSTTYDASTGTLVVTGSGFLSRSGPANDIVASKFTFTGEGGITYTLTDSANVEITSGTAFMIALSATDKTAVDALLNRNGTSSYDATTYNLAAAEDWTAGADATVTVADMTGNSITVSNVATPTITSTTYDANTGVLVVTGANIQAKGSGTDIDASKLTFTGDGGATYTLTDSADVERDSATQFTITLSTTDKAAINQTINKNGTLSTSGTPYNLAATDDWNTNVTDGDTADATENGITVSNVAVPTITSATYDASTGILVVTGAGFLKLSGETNDIDASKFTFTGEGGATYTLTNTANVEITSGTAFTITLSATDKAAINQIINKNGMSSSGGPPYNLAADEDWAAGADAAVTVADLTGNDITVSNVAAPSSGNNSTPTLIDGVIVTTTTQSDGAVLLTTPVVDITRQDDPTTLFRDHADIPVVSNSQDDPILTVSIPAGVGLSAEGQPQALNKQDAASDLIQRIEQKTAAGSEPRQTLTSHGQNFLDSLAPGESASVHTLELFVSDHQKPGAPIIITGPDAPTESKQILIIDASNLPADTVLHMNNVAFAVIIGSVRVVGGNGKNFVTADVQDQVVILGADDDILFGGGGNDTVGSLGGDDQVSGDAGNDIVYGGSANDTLNGGSGDDRLNGGLGFDSAIQAGQLTDFQVEIHGHEVVLTHRNGAVDTLTDVELVHFTSGPSLAIAHSGTEAAAHHLVKTWLGRDLTAAEGNAVQNWRDADVDDIVAAFLDLPEAMGLRDKTGSELLAGLENNPNIRQLDVAREFTGTTANNDQGYLPLGLALNADGGMGHDVLRMPGSRHDVHLEFVGDTLELTRLSDGAMLGLKNAEAIAFDNGETVILAHNSTEAILARLFHSFFNRDATAAEWQLGREALAAQMSPDIILDWFQQRAGLGDLSNTDYLQAIFTQTLGRQATETELNEQLPRLEKGQINREWLAVEIAGSTEAINLVGNVILHEGWI
ncbi:DUF4347 domain-containing protein [Nitrosomonas sp. Nm132]|uniref:DUF4347 domain-containing protein n=1 Tax=Nitrosomonas sp. Nm132 TaxID=1881053 RepID=UPI0008914B35|nr:DUF4347 domain-containing protein [Nitrosomonas sp. Nm132]SDH13381.1 protein of unknown function [Nitrosomonas sp. Nm132]